MLEINYSSVVNVRRYKLLVSMLLFDMKWYVVIGVEGMLRCFNKNVY